MPRETSPTPSALRRDDDEARDGSAADAKSLRTVSGTRPAVRFEDKATRRVSPFTMQMLAGTTPARDASPTIPAPPPAADVEARAEEVPSAPASAARFEESALEPTPAPLPAQAPRGSSLATRLALVAGLVVVVVVLTLLWMGGELRLPH